jgi:hypothetical protein
MSELTIRDMEQDEDFAAWFSEILEQEEDSAGWSSSFSVMRSETGSEACGSGCGAESPIWSTLWSCLRNGTAVMPTAFFPRSSSVP